MTRGKVVAEYDAREFELAVAQAQPGIYSTFDDMRGLRVFSRIRFPAWKAVVTERLSWGQSRLTPKADRR